MSHSPVGFSLPYIGLCQENGNWSNQESKFDFVSTCQRLVKIDKGQQKIKIVCTNQQSNLLASCESIFSLCQHHPIPYMKEMSTIQDLDSYQVSFKQWVTYLNNL